MCIDLLLSDRRSYTFEGYASRQVIGALDSLQVPHRIIYLNEGLLHDYFSLLNDAPPRWTLSFTPITPHKMPFCEVIQIPHFYWVESSCAPALHYLESRLAKIGIPDLNICKKLNNAQAICLPHGIDTTLSPDTKLFEVVAFADLMELSLLEKRWEELFSTKEIERIKKAVRRENPVEAEEQFYYAEQYLHAQITLRVVETWLSTVNLDLFGEHAGNNWLQRLSPYVHLHASLPYTEHFEVLKASKVVLLESTSPWYFPALAAGCLPLPVGEESLHYYLTHQKERDEKIGLLKENLLKTWMKQTQQLIEIMS